MSALSFLSTKFLPSMNARDRPSDPLSRLRFKLETMPGARKYDFTPLSRAEVLSELYDAFWGPYSHLFLPLSSSSLPMYATLSEVQAQANFSGAADEKAIIPGRPCGHIFTKGESCFRCKDCALDDSCVLCSRCFHASDHSDHNVSFFIAQQSGGCCDCGDREAWRSPIGCPLHPPLPDSEDVSNSQPGTALRTPKAVPKSITGADIPPVPNYPFRTPYPPELRELMSRTVAYALDFLLDTLDYSPDEATVPKNEAELRLQPSADPMMKDIYCVLIWNDDKHSFKEVTELICETTNRDRKEAYDITHAIDELGRAIIDMNANVTRLFEVAQIIAKIELGVTIRRAYDTFREQAASVIIEWLLDLTRSRMGTDTLILREIIAAELLSPRRTENNFFISRPQVQNVVSDVHNPSRLDWLFLYHTRLWKKPRLSLKEIYASILSLSHAHKVAIGVHFANVYNRVVDAYLLVDREAETSIKYFALQLFTVPSVALHIVHHHNLVSRLLDIITGFFTNQIAGKRIAYSPNSRTELDVDSYPFKSKRFMPVFSDLRYLCHNEPVQELIAHDHQFIREFAQVCSLFMCINPNKRVATTHVEYETDAWISVFNVTLSLSRVIKVYGEAFSRSTPAKLVAAVSTVLHEILLICTLANDRLDRTKFNPIEFHDVEFGNTVYTIINFDVLEGWVSFHHSLHWLLAELVKHVDILSEESLAQVGCSNFREVFMRTANEQAILTIVDFPLRVLAMIAQIRTGLWVRNGFPIRGQLLHYRDFMLRELCYDQDLFVLQSALIILDPNVVIVSILDRFGLASFFCGSLAHPVYEGVQLFSMVEEVFYVLITIFSEKANASKMPLRVAVRREIVHALAMGPCSFTDLVKRVAERMGDDICFEKVLKEVANFKPPESMSDFGVYELKDEAYDEVNPFFYHYTRNKREEVDTVLKNRLKRKTGNGDTIIVPKPLNITHGPYSILSSVFESEALLQIMFYAIYNIHNSTLSSGTAPPSAEAILDQALHLVMLALVERSSTFSQLAAAKTFENGSNLVDIICALEHDDNYKPYKSRVQWILSQMVHYVPDEVKARRRDVDVSAPEMPDPENERKRAAKARQEAIMAQMKAQQESFAVNFDDVDDGDDEDMEDTPEDLVSYGSCIVCQEHLNASRAFGTLGLIQPSRMLRKQPDGHSVFLNDILQSPYSMDRSSGSPVDLSFPPRDAHSQDSSYNPSSNFDGYPPMHTKFGLHASVCGHMMHLECFQVYSVSIRQRHRSHATRNHPENIMRKEYICPLCKSLGNVLLPVSRASTLIRSNVPFPDWIRAAGISILKSKPDTVLDSLQFKNGTGEFVFWSAQDPGYASAMRRIDKVENSELSKMVETVMVISRTFSQQTRHLRERAEPEIGERGDGLYLPEELVNYTISAMEVAMRGSEAAGYMAADSLSESQTWIIRGLMICLSRQAAVEFEGRLDGGREAIRQAIIKRLLPEWSRRSLTSFSYPLLLRDPFTVLVETAVVAPEMLQHVLVLTYYACLARTVIGMVYILNKARSTSIPAVGSRQHAAIFGDIRMFFMSVARHSPVFEHTATMVFETFGEARIEKLMYAFTLQFLRRAAILCRAVVPLVFPSPSTGDRNADEYTRLLTTLRIPPLSDLPNQDTLQNVLSGWCAHYGHSHASCQLHCGVTLDYPSIYRLARLPLVLDNLFGGRDKAMKCLRCNTVPVDAAICLLCGTTVCMLSHCCVDIDSNGRGECNMHTRECGGAMGIYFVVKRCSLLYLYANNGAFPQSPYLDVHGEVDISMRRGRRQYLHLARWEDIRKTWLNHGIPTVIARRLESTVDQGGWENL